MKAVKSYCADLSGVNCKFPTAKLILKDNFNNLSTQSVNFFVKKITVLDQ